MPEPIATLSASGVALNALTSVSSLITSKINKHPINITANVYDVVCAFSLYQFTYVDNATVASIQQIRTNIPPPSDVSSGLGTGKPGSAASLNYVLMAGASGKTRAAIMFKLTTLQYTERQVQWKDHFIMVGIVWESSVTSTNSVRYGLAMDSGTERSAIQSMVDWVKDRKNLITKPTGKFDIYPNVLGKEGNGYKNNEFHRTSITIDDQCVTTFTSKDVQGTLKDTAACKVKLLFTGSACNLTIYPKITSNPIFRR